MKTTIKTLVIAIAAIICSTIEASAQKLSAATIVDQHYASQTSNYKYMMLGLALAFGMYITLHIRRKKQLDRYFGRD